MLDQEEYENTDVWAGPDGLLRWTDGQGPGPDWVKPEVPETPGWRYLYTIHSRSQNKKGPK